MVEGGLWLTTSIWTVYLRTRQAHLRSALSFATTVLIPTLWGRKLSRPGAILKPTRNCRATTGTAFDLWSKSIDCTKSWMISVLKNNIHGIINVNPIKLKRSFAMCDWTMATGNFYLKSLHAPGVEINFKLSL